MKQANIQRLIVLKIEETEPPEVLDTLSAVPGHDILFWGPGDFSHGIGHPGEYDHALVLEAINKVLAAAQKHAKFACMPAAPENVRELAQMGFSFLNMGADGTTLVKECRNLVRHFSSSLRTEC